MIYTAACSNVFAASKLRDCLSELKDNKYLKNKFWNEAHSAAGVRLHNFSYYEEKKASSAGGRNIKVQGWTATDRLQDASELLEIGTAKGIWQRAPAMFKGGMTNMANLGSLKNQNRVGHTSNNCYRPYPRNWRERKEDHVHGTFYRRLKTP